MLCCAQLYNKIKVIEQNAMHLGIGIFGSEPQIAELMPILLEKDLKISAIWNKSVKEAAQIAKRFQIQFFTNKIDEILLRKDVDLVFVLYPPNLHAEISVKALGIGKHVVCNTPAGLSQCDSLRMVLAAQYYPSLISIINYPLRFIPTIQKLKGYLNDGYLSANNKIQLISLKIDVGSLIGDQYDWTCDHFTGGGILTLIASHYIDLITYLSGHKAVKAIGCLKTVITSTDKINGIRHISAPDFCSIQLEFPDNLLVTATFNSHYPKNYFNQELFICDSNNSYLTVRNSELIGFQKDAIIEELLYKDPDDSMKDVCNVSKYFIKGLTQMVDCLKEAFTPFHEKSGWNKEPVKTAAVFDDALYVQAVIEAIKRSSKTKEWEKVCLMTEQPEQLLMMSSNIIQQNSESERTVSN